MIGKQAAVYSLYFLSHVIAAFTIVDENTNATNFPDLSFVTCHAAGSSIYVAEFKYENDDQSSKVMLQPDTMFKIDDIKKPGVENIKIDFKIPRNGCDLELYVRRGRRANFESPNGERGLVDPPSYRFEKVPERRNFLSLIYQKTKARSTSVHEQEVFVHIPSSCKGVWIAGYERFIPTHQTDILKDQATRIGMLESTKLPDWLYATDYLFMKANYGNY